MSERPVTGISSYLQRAEWAQWDIEAVLLPRRYADKVSEAGGLPVLLPPLPGIDAIVPRLDALVLSGGGDLDPVLYGAEMDEHGGQPNEARDTAELSLFRAALAVGLPVLGICRGMQVINVAMGGTLIQHLPDVVGHDGHSPLAHGHGRHDVRIAAGSRLAALYGEAAAGGRPVSVHTHHHQAVAQLGAGLTATAWADDGTIEAMELDPAEHPSVIAVQWHPEAGDDLSPFRWLISAASRQPSSALAG
jgi:putative glutamine amidotransferase